MNNFFRFFKKNKTDTILVFILLLVTYKVWNLLPQLTIRRDGFVYLLSIPQNNFFTLPLFFTGFETSAMIFGYIFSRTYGVSLSLYYWTVLLVMMVINVLLYITVKKITKKQIVAFSASLLFGVNYFGVYDMVSSHCYCFFLERVIPVLFLLPSLLFLHLFLEKNYKKYYIISLFLYFIGVGIGHFSVLFTPLYVLYPIFWFLFNEKNSKLRGVIIGLSYLFLSAFFIALQQINESGLGPKKWTFLEFLSQPEKYLYVKKIFLQFVYSSQYPSVLKNYAYESLQTLVDPLYAEFLIPWTIVAYTISGVIIFKKLPKQKPMLFTTILGTVLIFFLNAYFNQYDILNFSSASRYLYFPSFLLAIFWSYFLWAVFFEKKNLLAIVCVGFMVVYYFTNSWLIEGNLKHELRLNKSTRAVFDYIIAKRSVLLKDTLIITPYPEFGSHESTFFTERLGKGEVRYMSEHNPDNVDTWEKQASTSAHVIRVKYNRSCSCIVEEKIK